MRHGIVRINILRSRRNTSTLLPPPPPPDKDRVPQLIQSLQQDIDLMRDKIENTQPRP